MFFINTMLHYKYSVTISVQFFMHTARPAHRTPAALRRAAPYLPVPALPRRSSGADLKALSDGFMMNQSVWSGFVILQPSCPRRGLVFRWLNNIILTLYSVAE